MTASIYQGGNFYVYLITDLNPVGEARYYIGSRTRITLVEKNVNPEDDPYMGSSTHPDMIQGLKERPGDFEKIIIEVHDDSDDCVLAEEWFQRQHFAVENPEFFNGVYAGVKFRPSSTSSSKRQNTMYNSIDDNGLNGYQRSGLKMLATRLNDIDESGLNSYQRATLKTTNTKRIDIDVDGLDSFQRGAKKAAASKFKHRNISFRNIGPYHNSQELCDALTEVYGVSPSKDFINKLIKINFNKLINNYTFGGSSFIQHFGRSVIGLSWADLGFSYSETSHTTTNLQL